MADNLLTVGHLVDLLAHIDRDRPVMVWDFTTGVPMRPTIRNGNLWDEGQVTIWPSDVAADGTTRTDPRGVDPTAPDPMHRVRVLLWFCPTDHHHRVQWQQHKGVSTPHCLEPGCGQVGESR